MDEQEKTPDSSKQEEGNGEARPNLTELYEKMSLVLRENLAKAGTLTEEAFERALKESREWAEKMREHYGDDIGKVAGFIRRDWHAAIQFTREQTRRRFDMDRLQVGLLDVLSSLARSAGEQLEEFANKINDRLTYKTGEIAGAGKLVCLGCQQQLSFEKATRIPPCPKCRHTSFRRTF